MMPTDHSQAPLEEVHIAGALVHARQDQGLAVSAAISALPTAEVMQATPEGRLVVVIEADSARHVVATLDHIHTIAGVLNVALVYQHTESAAAMREEIGT